MSKRIAFDLYHCATLLILINVVLWALISCDPSDTRATNLPLSGYWEIVEASRDGRSTLTLEKAFIHFQSDSVLSTNLLRKEVSSSYERIDNKIIQENPERIEYDISYMTEDSLRLKSIIRGYNFNFSLVYIDSLSKRLDDISQ